ncbi:YbhB/YbcL family Raf kinase inhibitor-like protein [Cytophagaceae bacterium YF14B1]|uniref:YbhB/YbcL family Raf kinase inhibitor-like protein n=1 Tax=Xanthocytophaga flava TaxID=3048013 RepID=A0AAE3U8Q6_9BACT|nr:YbhB/YbcL family Raf kinase inhibitor-like protein [Xanthocytophaga flavus]MDJ1473049.1 YbhB/YbcL family Raf kinase inhibitor-like protein [Xanthocytophaga flavus]MDJ1484274.1 YbhB/YbcL family Raf kinase inhibitor-like protein [Xanthocytophaga flavus]
MKKGLALFTACLMIGTMAMAQTFTLKSKEVGGQATQKEFANSFGCHGSNISPQLYWENAPAGTQSFAVTIYDKDAPTGSGFWHWVIFNIPANVTELKAGAGDISKALAPAGSIQSVTDAGAPGYIGPCPPPGAPHEYLITVYALKSKLSLDKNASPAYVGFNLFGNTIAKASIVMYAQQ